MTAVRTLLPALLCLALTACEREAHDMYRQPRYGPGDASPLFPDGRAARPPPDGSVAAAMGDLAATSGGRRGRQEVAQRDAAGAAASAAPSAARLRRGQERYAIFCMPCHSPVGDGDGLVVRRGFPRPPSYHDARLRDAPDRYFFDVITHGHGVMYAYADRVTPEDRWAIVAYIRALQLSQHATLAQLPPALRAPFDAASASAGARR